MVILLLTFCCLHLYGGSFFFIEPPDWEMKLNGGISICSTLVKTIGLLASVCCKGAIGVGYLPDDVQSVL